MKKLIQTIIFLPIIFLLKISKNWKIKSYKVKRDLREIQSSEGWRQYEMTSTGYLVILLKKK